MEWFAFGFLGGEFEVQGQEDGEDIFARRPAYAVSDCAGAMMKSVKIVCAIPRIEGGCLPIVKAPL